MCDAGRVIAVADAGNSPGSVVMGSYVQRSSGQLARLLALPGTAALEVRAPELLATGRRCEAELDLVRTSSMKRKYIMRRY